METDEQQLEEIKRWWSEHGRAVILGVVLGLGSVIGVSSWRAYVQSQGETLSARYEQLVNTAAMPDHSAAVKQADALIADHPDTSYASLAALVGARAAYKASDAATARRLLQWAADHGDAFEVRDVARIRLARLLSEDGQHDAAIARLQQVANEEFATLVAEVRGDVLSEKQDLTGARAAFEAALAHETLSSVARERIELKLDAITAGGG
jgi:predicted negative regulator of RcsB-dependent stress response